MHNLNKNGDTIFEEHQNGVDISGTPTFAVEEKNDDDDVMNDDDEELAKQYLLKNNNIRRHTIGAWSLNEISKKSKSLG